jgi:hypothetical protein
MDLLYFLNQRLEFTRNFYEQCTAPFEETKPKIEAGEETWGSFGWCFRTELGQCIQFLTPDR